MGLAASAGMGSHEGELIGDSMLARIEYLECQVDLAAGLDSRIYGWFLVGVEQVFLRQEPASSDDEATRIREFDLHHRVGLGEPGIVSQAEVDLECLLPIRMRVDISTDQLYLGRLPHADLPAVERVTQAVENRCQLGQVDELFPVEPDVFEHEGEDE